MSQGTLMKSAEHAYPGFPQGGQSGQKWAH